MCAGSYAEGFGTAIEVVSITSLGGEIGDERQLGQGRKGIIAREDGLSIGAVGLKCFRPFPAEEVAEAYRTARGTS